MASARELDAQLLNTTPDFESPVASGTSSSERNVQPPEACRVSSLLFTWVFPLLKRAAVAEKLEISDLFELESRAEPEALLQEFVVEWRRLVAEGPRRAGHALLMVLARVHIPRLWPLWIGRTVQTLLEFSFPLFLNLITKYVEDENASVTEGLLLALAYFACGLVQVIIDQNVSRGMSSCGLRMKSSLMTAIFRKTLLLRQDSMMRFTSGKLTNLITTDVDKARQVIRRMHILIQAPLTLVIAVVALYKLVGPSLFIGMSWMLVVILINPIMMYLSSKLEEKQQAKTDKRVQKVTEIVSGMQVVKCYAWERPATRNVERARKEELFSMWRLYCVYTVFEGLWSSVIPITTVLMFTSYSLLHPDQPLTAAQAFTAISLLSMVSEPLFSIPWVFNLMVEALVAAKRLEHLFFLPEVHLPCAEFLGTFCAGDDSGNAAEPDDSTAAETAVNFSGQSFKWVRALRTGDDRQRGCLCFGGEEEEEEEEQQQDEPSQASSAQGEANTSCDFELSNLVLQVPSGALVSVVGTTASGKTSLLQAILGEMPPVAAHASNQELPPVPVSHKTPIGFAPQVPWVFNGTVRDNILFGEPYFEKRYQECLKCCDLEQDLTTLKFGDETKVGEKGISLSGGQKARVCLARAAYRQNNSNMFVLDDPYSALDSHVARKVHEEAVLKFLRKRTRVVVTNRLEFVDSSDVVVVMKGGQIEAQGPYSEVCNSSTVFQELLKAQGIDVKAEETAPGPYQRCISANSIESGGGQEEVTEEQAAGGNDDQEEARASGNIKKEVFFYYLKHMGGCPATTLLASLYSFSEVINLAGPIWLAIWTASAEKHKKGDPDEYSFEYYLIVYVVLGVSNVVFMTVRDLVGNILGFRAAGSLHAAMFASVLRAPMSFFQDTPQGRIINRFSKDISEIDKELVWQMIYTLVPVLSMFGNFALVGGIAFFALLAFLPAFYLYYQCWKYYNKAALDLKRIDKVCKSPIYDHFSNLCRENATSVARAHHQVAQQCKRNNALVAEQQRPVYATMFVEQWFCTCVEVLGCVLVFFVAVFAVMGRGRFVSASSAALVLTFSGECSSSISNVIAQIAEFNMAFNCVERVMEYCTDLPSEALEVTDRRPQEGWPNQGVLEVQDLKLRYRPGLDLVLKGISFKTCPGERVGVVGRTGAGKSSLLLAILRIVEPEAGSIVRLDGENLLNLGLQDVRSRIAMIPQEPVLFQESLRYNCDPFEHHSAADIWKALEQAQLAPWIRERSSAAPTDASGHTTVSIEDQEDFEKLLKMEITEGGQNLSSGQRQMVAIARAVLRQARLVVLDEATASIDAQTDALIQTAIRQCFLGATSLTIAHRLQTILDNDRVIVLDSGEIAEDGKPDDLRAKEGGIFNSMVSESRL